MRRVDVRVRRRRDFMVVRIAWIIERDAERRSIKCVADEGDKRI